MNKIEAIKEVSRLILIAIGDLSEEKVETSKEETLIQEAARDNAGVPDHDCRFDVKGCCETCERYWEARDFWARESETNNQKLL